MQMTHGANFAVTLTTVLMYFRFCSAIDFPSCERTSLQKCIKSKTFPHQRCLRSALTIGRGISANYRI